MINSISDILDALDCSPNSEDMKLAEFFKENGYCILSKSGLIVENLDTYRKVIDCLIEKESWRGGWEGKEEYMKYKKIFQQGTHRLGNLFNKNKLFLKLLEDKNILKVLYSILGDDLKIGGLDFREPLKGMGLQDLHIDWIPKKNKNEIENIVCYIALDDTDENNGTLRVVPGTHKKLGWIDEHQEDKSSHPEEKLVNTKAGSVILMDANLWHGGTTNISGNRRRVLYMDIRRRKVPQLLNQRIYLDDNTQKELNEIEKYLLGVSENDEIFEDRVFTAGNVYRKEFKTNVFVNQQ